HRVVECAMHESEVYRNAPRPSPPSTCLAIHARHLVRQTKLLLALRFLGSPLSLRACIGTMNPPLTPPRRGTDRPPTDACSPPGRGRGWVASWKGPPCVSYILSSDILTPVEN